MMSIRCERKPRGTSSSPPTYHWDVSPPVGPRRLAHRFDGGSQHVRDQPFYSRVVHHMKVARVDEVSQLFPDENDLADAIEKVWAAEVLLSISQQHVASQERGQVRSGTITPGTEDDQARDSRFTTAAFSFREESVSASPAPKARPAPKRTRCKRARKAQDADHAGKMGQPRKRSRQNNNYDANKQTTDGRNPESLNMHHQRFSKNIALWLKSLSNTGSTLEQLYNKLEQWTGPLIIGEDATLGIPAEYDAMSAPNPGESSGRKAQGLKLDEQDDIARMGLSPTEVEACNHHKWHYAKYRVLRSALIIGVGCIYEQNARGLSGLVCDHHRSIIKKGNDIVQYDSINVGKSQAQSMAPGIDANEAADVFEMLQYFGWFPKAFLQQEMGPRASHTRLHDNIELRIPHTFRKKVMKKYEDWERKNISDEKLRMIITEDDCDCSCSNPRVKKYKGFSKGSIQEA